MRFLCKKMCGLLFRPQKSGRNKNVVILMEVRKAGFHCSKHAWICYRLRVYKALSMRRQAQNTGHKH